MTGREVFWKLANGQVYQQPFTVREGETMFDIARELEAAKFMRAGDFLFAAGDPALIRDLRRARRHSKASSSLPPMNFPGILRPAN